MAMTNAAPRQDIPANDSLDAATSEAVAAIGLFAPNREDRLAVERPADPAINLASSVSKASRVLSGFLAKGASRFSTTSSSPMPHPMQHLMAHHNAVQAAARQSLNDAFRRDYLSHIAEQAPHVLNPNRASVQPHDYAYARFRPEDLAGGTHISGFMSPNSPAFRAMVERGVNSYAQSSIEQQSLANDAVDFEEFRVANNAKEWAKDVRQAVSRVSLGFISGLRKTFKSAYNGLSSLPKKETVLALTASVAMPLAWSALGHGGMLHSATQAVDFGVNHAGSIAPVVSAKLHMGMGGLQHMMSSVSDMAGHAMGKVGNLAHMTGQQISDLFHGTTVANGHTLASAQTHMLNHNGSTPHVHHINHALNGLHHLPKSVHHALSPAAQEAVKSLHLTSPDDVHLAERIADNLHQTATHTPHLHLAEHHAAMTHTLQEAVENGRATTADLNDASFSSHEPVAQKLHSGLSNLSNLTGADGHASVHISTADGASYNAEIQTHADAAKASRGFFSSIRHAIENIPSSLRI